MASDENIQEKSQSAAETMTYLYPSSDSTVLIPDGNLDDVPYKTGKHSIVGGKKASVSSNEVADPFAPKTVPDESPLDLELKQTPKRRGCIASFVFAVVFCIVVVAALWVVQPF